MGKAWIQGLLEHGKEICSSFKSNEVIKIKSNRKSRNKSEKFSKKRKFRNPGCYTDSPALIPSLSGPGVCVCNSCYKTITWRAESRTHLSKRTRPSTEHSRKASNVRGTPSRPG